MSLLLLILLGWVVISQDALGQASPLPEGFTEPFQTVEVASPDAGVLQSLRVTEGSRIQVGEVIGQLDAQVLRASLNAARDRLQALGKIKGAQANLDSKAHQLQQMQSLLRQQHASDQEVKQAQLEFDLAQANLDAANDEMRAWEMDALKIEAQLERRTVRSPIAGTVLKLPRQVGEAITTSDSHIATLVALDQLRVRYFLATDRATRLQKGQQVRVHFPTTNQTAVARVEFVSPITDSKSDTVRVELLIDNPQGQYRSGLRCLLGENLPTRSAQTPTLSLEH